MGYIIITIIAFISGIAVGYFYYNDKKKKLDRERIEFDRQKGLLSELREKLLSKKTELGSWEDKLQKVKDNVIGFEELQAENMTLKTDMQNMDVECRKLSLDRDLLDQKQNEIDRKTDDLGQRYLRENIKWISSKLTTNNYVNSKENLLKAIELCRGIGLEISNIQEQQLISDLKKEYELILRADYERQEQARIKEQIREEQKLEREVQRELDQLERERAAIQAALEKALQEAEDKHSDEIERLRARLKEAEEKSQRAISQAQMTKSGHVYVISNVGSFGKEVFKIGMTRRLEPDHRVKELSGASVPFPYDIHMMISCNDAPALENALHKELHKSRINRVNLRKEFFKTDINAIKDIVKKNHGEVSYVADAEALEYYQSIKAPEEDYEFIEQAYSKLDDEENAETVE
jgi:hypothetical protein